MIFSAFKAKLAALGAIGLSVIAFFLRFKQVKHQRDKAQYRARVAEANVKRVVKTRDADSAIEVEYASRRAAAKAEIKRGEVPKNLREPNDDW